jgi:glycogen debranching enzyme
VKAAVRRGKPRLVLDETICSDLSLSRSREWLETNGIGGYASSTITGYHQGTVWPWLLGPFFTAWMKVHKPGRDSRATVRSWLSLFERHLGEGGLGQVSEIFDGDEPYEARGCVAQAWSVAELLRVAVGLADGDAAVRASQQKRTSRGVRPIGRALSKRAKSPRTPDDKG